GGRAGWRWAPLPGTRGWPVRGAEGRDRSRDDPHSCLAGFMRGIEIQFAATLDEPKDTPHLLESGTQEEGRIPPVALRSEHEESRLRVDQRLGPLADDGKAIGGPLG